MSLQFKFYLHVTVNSPQYEVHVWLTFSWSNFYGDAWSVRSVPKTLITRSIPHLDIMFSQNSCLGWQKKVLCWLSNPLAQLTQPKNKWWVPHLPSNYLMMPPALLKTDPKHDTLVSALICFHFGLCLNK